MKNDLMAKNYLEDARIELDQADFSFEKGNYHVAFRRAQSAVEFSLKAILRAYGIEYPKEHEVSDILNQLQDKFPNWFKIHLEEIKIISKRLSAKRGLSIYGDERRGIPAKDLFRKEEAAEVIEKTRFIFGLSQKLLASLKFYSK